MSNHTPGKWALNTTAETNHQTLFVYSPRFGPICEIPHRFKCIKEHEANAKLIAAAPNMLQALQAALKLSDAALAADIAAGYDEINRTPECQAVYNLVKAAIDKAIL